MNNIDQNTVESFGNEWERFDQRQMSEDEAKKIFDNYFDIFPWEQISLKSEGFDMGCGSGRWAKFIAPKVAQLNCIDPSSAIHVAEKALSQYDNVRFIHGSTSDSQLIKGSQDFGYSLGVLHHVPETESAIESCVELLKIGAPLLLYLYYAFDNRPYFYRVLWKLSNIIRFLISKLPLYARNIVTDIITVLVYLPLAYFSKLVEKLGFNSNNLPLSWYRNSSFYTMRTDSRDRFGTPLEKRFTQKEIKKMMINSGLTNIYFSDHAPFWCVVGFKK